MRRFMTAAAIVALLLSPAQAVEQFGDGAQFLGHATSSNSATNPPPTATGCTVSAGSTDLAGSCTASAASGSITFGKAFLTAPSCLIVDASATSTVSMPVYTVAVGGITLTTIISAHVLFWSCVGKQGN